MENKDKDLVVVVLRRSNGLEDHCATLFGKWVFDSKLKKALPLTQENLDLCCSVDTSNILFHSVVQALFVLFLRHIEKN